MAEKVSNALTLGEIARLTNQPIHRIGYIVQSRNIKPSQRAGNLRLFSSDDLAMIKSELARIAERKGGER